jgi:kynurenine formamidase
MTFPYKLIDLTHMLEHNIPTWDGGCGFHPAIHLDYQDCEGDTQFRVMTFSMQAGIGTHMDAPSHVVPGGACVHDFELQNLCMPCVVIDVSDKVHERYRVIPEDILGFETMHGMIDKGSCVMIKTGWETFWGNPERYRNNHVFPSVSIEVAHLLLERGVRALGIDTLSPDRPEDGFKVHQAFLGRGKILIENVANLDQMPPIGGFVMALPLKVKEATEAPVRLVGLIAL